MARAEALKASAFQKTQPALNPLAKLRPRQNLKINPIVINNESNN